MKFKQTLIAASILGLCASGSTLARGANDLHENQWHQTTSYDQVSINDDSVQNWGPWDNFVEPAAGGPLDQSPAQMLGAGSNDPYRNLASAPQIQTLTENICASGDWCGYAIFANTTTKSGGKERTLYSGKQRDAWIAGLFAMTLAPDNSKITAGKGAGNGNASWRLASLGTIDPIFNSSGTNLETAFGGGTFSPEQGYWSQKPVKVNGRWTLVNDKWIVTNPAGSSYDNRDPGLQHLTASNQTKAGGASLIGFSQNANANEASNTLPNLSKTQTNYFEQAITGTEYKYTVREQRTINILGWTFTWFEDVKKTATLSADPALAIGYFDRVQTYVSGEGKSAIQTTETTRGYYVAGIATSETYLSSQRAGNVSATYVGGSFDGSNQGKVQMTVNFQPGTWTGAWTDNGNFNFNASGTVSGANISGNVVNTKNMTGTVNGTFYGAQAGSIGGVSSVQNIKTAEVQNAIFVVNKVPAVTVAPTPK